MITFTHFNQLMIQKIMCKGIFNIDISFAVCEGKSLLAYLVHIFNERPHFLQPNLISPLQVRWTIKRTYLTTRNPPEPVP